MSGRKRWTHLDQMVAVGIVDEETIRNSDVSGVWIKSKGDDFLKTEYLNAARDPNLVPRKPL
jgi:hypothetical protein